MTTAVTIPKKLAMRGDLVMIPRAEYRSLIAIRENAIKEVSMSAVQKKALNHARKNLAAGKALSFYAFTRKLGLAHR